MSISSPTAFAGVDGNVTIGALANISVREWKITISGEPINVTSTNDGGYKTNIVGPVGGEGTFKVNADCNSFLLQQLYPIATQCVTAPQAANLELGTSPNSIGCTVRITKVDVTNPAEEEVTLEFSFVTTGAISYYT